MASKKRAVRTKPKSRRSGRDGITQRDNVITASNDNISHALSDLVPERFQGTNRYLDVVQWNLEWFGAEKSKEKDVRRYDLVLDILDSLNGDLFVLQEIAGPSYDGRYPGALDQIASDLRQRGAGDYVVYYTQAGGEQRVAMMWDREWIRSKTDVKDLFPKGTHTTDDGKDAFAQRTPLYGYFSTRVPGEARDEGGSPSFDFQMLGVHLKAMAEGHAQRLESARVLADWMTTEAPRIDTDVLIMGDWNAPPDDECWAPFHELETGNMPKVVFQTINDPSDFSYLWLKNRSDQFTSKIDLAAMSLASHQKVVGKAAQVVRWKPIEEVIAKTGSLTDKEVVAVLREIKEMVSDHLPTVARFYFTK